MENTLEEREELAKALRKLAEQNPEIFGEFKDVSVEYLNEEE